MGTTVLKHANAMPAPTWHRLHISDTDIEVPALDEPAVDVSSATIALLGAGLGEEGAFDAALAGLQRRLDAARAHEPADTRAVLRAAEGSADPSDLDVPALSAYEARAVSEEVENDVAAAFECGLGPDADEWTVSAARIAEARTVITCPAGQEATARVVFSALEGVAAADVDVVVGPGGALRLAIEYDSPAGGLGAVALRLRAFVGANARLDVETIQTLDEGWTALEGSGLVLDDGARATVLHRVLGAKASYTGLAADLRGDGASIDIDTRYVGHASNVVDFNYIVRHRGKKTVCNLDANGVLMGESRKTLRGTIDLVHGCKGSEGSERDTVLIADARATNKTVPVILCDEDDVAGNHGATIGHVRREQMNYLQSRGLSPEAAEGLFATATLEEAAAHAPSPSARAGVVRIAAGLDVPFDAGEEDER